MLLTAPILAAGAAFLTLSLLCAEIYRRWTGPISQIPGPWYTRITCQEIRLYQVLGQRVWYLAELHKKYGPIVRVGPTEVSVAGKDSVRDIHKAGAGYLKTEWYTRFVIQEEPTLFTARDPAVHQMWRRMLAPVMSESNIKTLQSTVQDKTKMLMDGMAKEQEKHGHMDLYKWAHFFSNDVIGLMSFGSNFNMLEKGENNQYINDIKSFSRLNLKRMIFTEKPLWELPRIPLGFIGNLYGLRDRILGYGIDAIKRYRLDQQANPDNNTPTFFSHLMGDRGKSAGLTDFQLATQAQGFLIAGTDTTAVTLSFIIYMISLHPAVKEKLVKSLAHLPDEPSNEDLKAVSYLDLVINETLRLYGAAPSPLPRSVPQGGRTLGGYHIPENYTVAPVGFVLHRDPTIFKDPLRWDPERWENPTEDMLHSFFPFGGGPRTCIGMHLARMELRMAVFAFFRRFPNAVPAFGSEGFKEEDMQLLEFFLVRPKGGRCLMKDQTPLGQEILEMVS